MAIGPDKRAMETRRLCTVYELGTKRDFLRTFYGMVKRGIRDGIEEVRAHLELRQDAADRACDFWLREGVLKSSPRDRLSLTNMGVRRAERLEQSGWSLADL